MEQQTKQIEGFYLPEEDLTMCEECLNLEIEYGADPNRELITIWTDKTSACDFCDQVISPRHPTPTWNPPRNR